ncbi:MAG TPA: hypothetical protein VIK11_04145 [Tepidiformaceae bacterium]
MTRRIPPEYRGWEGLQPGFRRLTTTELIAEVQDGAPLRRLAALSVINLHEVPQTTIEDWIRTLPDTEANELAGAIPVQRGDASCHEGSRWVDVALLGYEQRRLPTFLVMLFSTLEVLEARRCPEAAGAWERVADWLGVAYDRLVAAEDHQALADVSLFVFENYLDRDAVFEAFCGLIARHLALAMTVSLDPRHLLRELPEAQQRFALREAELAGGLPFNVSWPGLQGRPKSSW